MQATSANMCARTTNSSKHTQKVKKHNPAKQVPLHDNAAETTPDESGLVGQAAENLRAATLATTVRAALDHKSSTAYNGAPYIRAHLVCGVWASEDAARRVGEHTHMGPNAQNDFQGPTKTT